MPVGAAGPRSWRFSPDELCVQACAIPTYPGRCHNIRFLESHRIATARARSHIAALWPRRRSTVSAISKKECGCANPFVAKTADRAQELRDHDREGQKCIRTQGNSDPGSLSRRGDDDKRNIHATATPAKLRGCAKRTRQVDQDEIWHKGGEQRRRFIQIPRGTHSVVLLCENLRQHLSHRIILGNHQDAARDHARDFATNGPFKNRRNSGKRRAAVPYDRVRTGGCAGF